MYSKFRLKRVFIHFCGGQATVLSICDATSFSYFQFIFSHSFHIMLNYLLVYMGGFDLEQKSEINVQVEIGY